MVCIVVLTTALTLLGALGFASASTPRADTSCENYAPYTVSVTYSGTWTFTESETDGVTDSLSFTWSESFDPSGCWTLSSASGSLSQDGGQSYTSCSATLSLAPDATADLDASDEFPEVTSENPATMTTNEQTWYVLEEVPYNLTTGTGEALEQSSDSSSDDFCGPDSGSQDIAPNNYAGNWTGANCHIIPTDGGSQDFASFPIEGSQTDPDDCTLSVTGSNGDTVQQSLQQSVSLSSQSSVTTPSPPSPCSDARDTDQAVPAGSARDTSLLSGLVAAGAASASCSVCPNSADDALLKQLDDYIHPTPHKHETEAINEFKQWVKALRARGGSQAQVIDAVDEHAPEYEKQLRAAYDEDLKDLESAEKDYLARAMCPATRAKIKEEFKAARSRLKSELTGYKQAPDAAVGYIKLNCGCGGYGPPERATRRGQQARFIVRLLASGEAPGRLSLGGPAAGLFRH